MIELRIGEEEGVRECAGCSNRCERYWVGRSAEQTVDS